MASTTLLFGLETIPMTIWVHSNLSNCNFRMTTSARQDDETAAIGGRRLHPTKRASAILVILCFGNASLRRAGATNGVDVVVTS